jgi:hypothetical protein
MTQGPKALVHVFDALLVVYLKHVYVGGGSNYASALAIGSAGW